MLVLELPMSYQRRVKGLVITYIQTKVLWQPMIKPVNIFGLFEVPMDFRVVQSFKTSDLLDWNAVGRELQDT